MAIGNALALGSGPVFAALSELVVDRTRVSSTWVVTTGLSIIGIFLLAGAAASQPGEQMVLGIALGLAD